MSKKEVKELQDSLLELVPYNVRNSKELTRSSKILLGNFIFLSGMDKAKKNGYVFRSNTLLVNDTKLSNKTIIKNISKLIQLGFITRSTGNRVEGASTYILNSEMLKSYQGCNFKGVISKKTTPINYTNKLEDKINAMSLEIKELKSMVKELMGVISDMGVKINYTTDTDIDPEKEINKNITNVNNIKPEVIKHEVNIKTYINSDENKNINAETNVITENDNNINIDNSNSNTLKNLNNENEMNEERVNEMNNINKSNETYMNTSTLEEMLETQALDDNQAFNNFSSFKNKETNYSQPEQERYQRLFEKCKSQIEIWMKTHEYSCISMFDAYFKAIQDMNNENLISVKQWDAAQRCLFQRFKNLRNGYNNYIQNKNKTISSNEVSECNNPQPPRQQNDQMEEVV